MHTEASNKKRESQGQKTNGILPYITQRYIQSVIGN